MAKRKKKTDAVVLVHLLIYITGAIIFYGTGEIFLFLITGGKRKPNFNRIKNESGFKAGIFIEISYVIGLLFWFALIMLIVKYKG